MNLDTSLPSCTNIRRTVVFNERRRTMAKVVGPTDGKPGRLGGIGVRFMIDGIETGEQFSLVEHPMPPRSLAAPLHLHTRRRRPEGRAGRVRRTSRVLRPADEA